jgi:hypothetical protein
MYVSSNFKNVLTCVFLWHRSQLASLCFFLTSSDCSGYHCRYEASVEDLHSRSSIPSELCMLFSGFLRNSLLASCARQPYFHRRCSFSDHVVQYNWRNDIGSPSVSQPIDFLQTTGRQLLPNLDVRCGKKRCVGSRGGN